MSNRRASGLKMGQAFDGFIITVKTDNIGTSNNDQFEIPTISGANPRLYDVETSDGQIILGNTGNLLITFPSAGTYDINISGVVA